MEQTVSENLKPRTAVPVEASSDAKQLWSKAKLTTEDPATFLIAHHIFVTDQTSAHDPLGGYVPAGLSLDEAASLRVDDPEKYQRRAFASMAVHCEAMVVPSNASIESPDDSA